MTSSIASSLPMPARSRTPRSSFPPTDVISDLKKRARSAPSSSKDKNSTSPVFWARKNSLKNTKTVRFSSPASAPWTTTATISPAPACQAKPA
ncbi:UNVERIFIED_CONTAM: hypothetical protein GTU68_037002 [Idotea baltica]|nr:hypothetical protein [Idotea baltica]